jgi:lysine-specific permease
LGIAISHYRFRRAFRLQGFDESELTFKARLFPFGPIFAFFVCLFVLVGQGYDSWFAKPVVAADIIACYIGIPIVVILYVGYKVVKKTKLIPLIDVDLVSGREEILRYIHIYIYQLRIVLNPYIFFLFRHTMEMEENKKTDPLEGVSIFKPATWKRIPSNLKSWRDAIHN